MLALIHKIFLST